ncbi:MAG: hypothetical protein L0207_02245 [Chlamydiae bacterium]|nr:hypothetical protein [Chlamydiota bacterium]
MKNSWQPLRCFIPSKKILVLSSRGGYGHVVAAKSLESLLPTHYALHIVYPINELKIWGVPSGESFYNALITNNWNRMTNFIVRNLAPPIFQARLDKTEKLIAQHIEEQKADLVISLIPFINYPASEAARKAGIPFLLITTDYDLHNFIYKLDQVIHPKFKMTVSSHLPAEIKIVLNRFVSVEVIEEIGLPLRPQFYSQRNKAELKEKYKIGRNQSVILLMFGGVGVKNLIPYTKEIAKCDLNTHIIICTGKNKNIISALQDIHVHPNNSIQIFPFTEEIPELMTISDLAIMKSGSISVTEAIAMKVPLFVDVTNAPLFWEKLNVDMISSFGIGGAIYQFSDLKKLLQNLQNQGMINQMRSAFLKIPENQFNKKIVPLIEQMFN